MERPLLLLAVGLVAGCGHISNAPIDEDADFLAALPDRTRQALVSPEDAAEAGAIRTPWGGPAPVLGGPDRWTVASHERRELTFLAPDFAPTDDGDDRPPGALPGHGGWEMPQWSDPDDGGHGGVDLADPTLPALSPVAQAREAIAALGETLDRVFDAADLARGDAPTASEAGAREWSDLPWHGSTVDVTMAAAGEAEYAWAMTSPDGAVFLDGEHAGYPTMRTGSGEFRFDQGAWADAYGVDAAGIVTVAYDNRAGVALALHLDGMSYPDADVGCAAAAPPVVTLGPEQRYLREGDEGDYQFVTTRLHGCGEEAEAAVRVRWTAEGGRADARLRVGGHERWAWTQCWVGAFDPDQLAYEHLRVAAAPGASDPIESGEADRCVFADFGEVDPALAPPT